MSEFKVSIERINEIKPHANADRLEIATLQSMEFQFIVPKNEYRHGDAVIYFPIDSVLPENVIEKLGLTGKLSGGAKNRVRTIKLRNVISQGVVAKPEFFFNNAILVDGQDITSELGVVKYEPEEKLFGNGGNGQRASYLKPLPNLVSVYDIEGCDRNKDLLNRYLMNEPVMITEKIEGSHFSISLYDDDKVVVCQRRFSISEEEAPDHAFVQLAKTSGLYNGIFDVRNYLRDKLNYISNVLTIRAEAVGPGIQGNIYKLNKHELFVFEIEVNGVPIPAEHYRPVVFALNLNIAPIYCYNTTLNEYLFHKSFDSVVAASNGSSVINSSVLREGIVIRPMKEIWDERFGRVILKQRSPEYLAKNDL